jgi:hypothetical protein
MKPLRSIVLVASALGAMINACDETTRLPDRSTPVDAGSEADVVGPDADADTDADAKPSARDAAVDAPPSSCSIDGFCWTTLPPKQTLRRVWSDALGSAWAVSEQGNVLRWDGSSWSIQWTAPGPLAAIWASGPTDLWIGGQSGLFHGQGSSPSSITWTQVPFDDVMPVVDVAGSGPNDVWVIGNRYNFSANPAQTSLVRHFGGGGDPSSLDAWELDPISYRPGLLRKILVRPSGDAWLAGDWDGRFPTPPAYVLHRESTDNGNGMTWVEQTIPYDSKDIFGNVISGGFVGDGFRILGRRVGTNVPSTWVASAPSPAGAVTWSEDTTPKTIDLHFAVWGTSPSDVYLAGLNGRFRHFDGTSWSYVRISIDGLPVVNNFLAMAINPAKELWVVGNDIALHKQFP